MNLSLNNLTTFIKIADNGSFSAAARHMGKAQSAVSTAISNLEIDLGVKLFSRDGKFPVLTREGQVLLREARQIVNSCQIFRERASAFEGGIDSILRIAVDEIFSQEILLDLLERFGAKYPATELEVLYGVLGDIQMMVEQGRVDIGILIPGESPSQIIPNRLVSHIGFIPVASFDHPLAAKKRLTRHDLESHRQLVITSRGGEREDESIIFGKQIWMIESTFAIMDLVYRGAGWSFLPTQAVARDLKKGRLVKLSLFMDNVEPLVPVYLIWTEQRRLGMAGQWMLEELSKIDDYHGTLRDRE
ncbi:MAG: LysR family transcriptional regulator [Desulfobacteraceae bacterium]|nr:LysR family transcriptional regulator [Desulfobacteraceae bacterium]